METSLRGSNFIFDCVHLLYYKCHNINPSPGGSNIDFSNGIKSHKATINLIDKKDSKCFQYATTVALNDEEIQKDPKIKPFINKYNWEGINSPSEKDDWTTFGKNNLIIALNVFYAKSEKIYPNYVSKQNSKREKQVILLMISNGEG